jgi:disulfide bond formation protein DsbB
MLILAAILLIITTISTNIYVILLIVTTVYTTIYAAASKAQGHAHPRCKFTHYYYYIY